MSLHAPLGSLSREEDGYRVVFNRQYNHPIEKVWAAITDPAQMRFWFTDVEMDFRPGGKMTIHFRDGKNEPSHGEIVTIEPPRLFVWTWEGELGVWELEPLGPTSTRLRLTYGKMNKEYALGAAAGFHTLLSRLEDCLNGSEMIYPFGTEGDDPDHKKIKTRYAAASHFNLPELADHPPVVIEKHYPVAVDRVWKALTDKEQMKQWYFDPDAFRPEVGFSFSFPGQGHKGEKYLHRCVITEVTPHQLLQYSWAYESHPGYSLVTFRLKEENGGTTLTLTHHGLDSFPANNPDFAVTSFTAGWTELITRLLFNFLTGK